MSQPLTRRRLTMGAAVAAAGLGLGLVGPVVSAQAATSDDFARLRVCESGDNYSINTGNGYFGAYQFSLDTWRGLGGTGYPNQASAATQDALAQKLQGQRGWAPWPSCSRQLGLGSSPAVHVPAPVTAPAVPTVVTTASRSQTRTSYQGTLLTTTWSNRYRADVQALQAQLSHKGYSLAVDGYFGPETRGVVMAFQRDAGIAVDGVVGPQTWGAAF